MLIILCSFAHGLAPAVSRYLAKRLDDVLYSKSKQRQTFTMGFCIRATTESCKTHEVGVAFDSKSLLVSASREFTFYESVHRWWISTNTKMDLPAPTFLFYWRDINSMLSRASIPTADFFRRTDGITDMVITWALNEVVIRLPCQLRLPCTGRRLDVKQFIGCRLCCTGCL